MDDKPKTIKAVNGNGVVVKLSGSQWAGILFAIVLVTLATSTTVYSSLDRLSNKVDTKVSSINQELSREIHEVEKSIPPVWFRELVSSHSAEIVRLSKEQNDIKMDVRDLTKQMETLCNP